MALVRWPGASRQRKAGKIDLRVGESTRAAREEIKNACGFSGDAEYVLLRRERKGETVHNE